MARRKKKTRKMKREPTGMSKYARKVREGRQMYGIQRTRYQGGEG